MMRRRLARVVQRLKGVRPCSDTKIRPYFQFDRILSFPTGPNAERRSLDLTNGPSIFGRGMYARRQI